MLLLGVVDEQVVRHVLARHDPLRCAESSKRSEHSKGDGDRHGLAVRFRGNELLGLVAVGGVQVRPNGNNEHGIVCLPTFNRSPFVLSTVLYYLMHFHDMESRC